MSDHDTPPSLTTKVILQLLVWVPLIGTAYAIYSLWGRFITPLDLFILVIGYVLCALGITIGYHRMLTHKGFEAPDWVRAFFLIFGSMSFQGPALNWAATHIQHHANSDDDEDPHSPVKSFWHAHVGWILDDFKPDVQKFATPLLKDKLVVFISNTFLLWAFLGLFIPFMIGYCVGGLKAGFYAFLWGGLVRMFLNHHVTWAVNSVCHTYGGREFVTTDQSRNNFIIGLLAMGEGWHNNHHAFPRSANHGMHWWQIDPSAWVIAILERMGIIKSVVRISEERLAVRRIQHDHDEERNVLPGVVLPPLSSALEPIIESVSSLQPHVVAGAAAIAVTAATAAETAAEVSSKLPSELPPM
jgi:stearoyl-CoA desaturase (Delta-9 desaturase)